MVLSIPFLIAATIVIPGPTSRFGGASTTLNNSLISYWKLDETSGTRVDSEPTGTAQDLTDNNTVTSNTGKIGNAGQFTAGNSEYLSRADSADLSTGDIDFTIACWVYLDSEPGYMMAVSKSGLASQKEFQLYYTPGDRFEFEVSNNGTSDDIVTANSFGAVSTGTWYFLVAWHDSVANTINICVNNGTVDSSSHTTGVFDSTSAFQIGRLTSTLYWDGRIDEVGFWKKVLTASERTELYNGGSGKTCCPF